MADNTPPTYLSLKIKRGEEAALLLVVLTNNAKPWNARLREELTQVVSPTAAYQATLKLQGSQ